MMQNIRACVRFFRKRAKKFENLGKNVQNFKYCEKEQPHVCDFYTHETARIARVQPFQVDVVRRVQSDSKQQVRFFT